MHTTHETSKQLQQSGFPQPEPREGQIWYGLIKRQEEPLSILKERDYFVDRYGNYHKKEAFVEWGVFAPTATDILRELGVEYNLVCGEGIFYVRSIDYRDIVHRVFNGHENPAEAAALAWLDYQKRQKA